MKFIFVLLILTISQNGQSQITLLAPSGNGGFESGTTFTANGWTEVTPGTGRMWRVGTAAGSSAGTRAAYAGGSSNHNGINSSAVHHFYRDVAIPSGVTATLNYKYFQPTIDDGFDYFNIFATTTANTPVLNTFPTTGYTILFENTATVYSGFTVMSSINLSSYAGSTVRLVFTFDSDGVSPHANPAIDEISITYCNNVTQFNVTGGGNICSVGGTPLSIGLSGSQTGLNYQLKRDGANVGSAISGTGSALSFPAQSIAGTYTIEATGTNFCTTTMTGNAIVKVNSVPSAPAITQGILNARCSSVIDSLRSSGGVILENSISSSGTLNLAIPDNSATGVTNTIAVSGISTSAVIDSVVVLFNLSHEWLQDAEILLRAPNNRIIALAANQGPSGVGSYTNCRISSNNSAAVLSTTSTPITGTFRANATIAANLIGSFGANLTSTFSDLFTTINGNWRIEAYDDAGSDLGTLLNWTLKISYRDTQTIWSPLTGLFTNSAATIPYTGTNLRTVYTKPDLTTKYIVTSTNGACTQKDSIVDSVKTASNLVTLASSSVSGAVQQCQDGTWTYYAAASTPNQWIFAIEKGSSGIAGEAVSIGVSATPYSSTLASNGPNQQHRSWLMGRDWDVTVSTQPSTPVKVRFFYDPADTTAVNTDRDAAFAALPGGTIAVKTPFEWFKTTTVPYNAGWRSAIVGNKFPATHTKLTPTYGTQNGVNYAEFSVASFSGGTGGAGFGPSGGGGVGLPVTWAGFDVKTAEVGNELTWKTASEQNTDYFEVQYSYDAKEFIAIPEHISAAGNSADLRTYNFTHADFAPFVYYRIKQVDLDGKFDYSAIKLAKRAAGASFVVNVFPIPMQEDNLLHVSAKGIDKSAMSITMTDITGKVIRHLSYIPSSESIKESFDMSPLTPGLYFIEVQNGQGKETFKVSR